MELVLKGFLFYLSREFLYQWLQQHGGYVWVQKEWCICLSLRVLVLENGEVRFWGEASFVFSYQAWYNFGYMIWCDCWDVRYGFIFPLTIVAVSSIFNILSCNRKKKHDPWCKAGVYAWWWRKFSVFVVAGIIGGNSVKDRSRQMVNVGMLDIWSKMNHFGGKGVLVGISKRKKKYILLIFYLFLKS